MSRIKKQSKLEMEYHLRRLYPTLERRGFYALLYKMDTNLANSSSSSLEEQQQILEEARSAYLRGQVGMETLKDIELKYETDYVSSTKSLISLRRNLSIFFMSLISDISSSIIKLSKLDKK